MNVALTKTPAEMAYGNLSLPHRRMEDWRWTDLRQLIDRPYPPRQNVAAEAKDVVRLLRMSPFRNVAGPRIVFVNGLFDAACSKLPSSGFSTGGVIGANPVEPVDQMNAAFATDGARLTIDGTIDTPIGLVFISTEHEARTIAVRNRIEIVAGASATLIETHVGEGSYLANSVTELVLGEGARLDRVKAELESPEAIHLAHCHVTLAKASILRDFTLTSGARVNRQNGTYAFDGPNADAKIAGAYLLAGRQHADTRLLVDHKVPQCTSRELFHCVMDEQARGIFQGKVVVQRNAQKTDGKQSSHALLLSATAEFDAKPELEIFADDVVCGHGATVGELDEDQLFYLRSRGIPEEQAKSMLIAAFVGEAFETVAHEGIRAALTDFAANWLERRK